MAAAVAERYRVPHPIFLELFYQPQMAAESPTVLCARREMESWRILQLEPSALREPDEINAPPI